MCPMQDRAPTVWRPIEPLLTHCRSIESIDFAVRPDEISDGWAEDVLSQLSSNPRVWQQITITIRVEPDPKNRTSITFINTVFFSFQQSVMGGSLLGSLTAPDDDARYDLAPLAGLTGFSPRIALGSGLSSVGAFCLWESDHSAVVERIAQEWPALEASLADRMAPFHHYQLSCDSYGEVHVICTAVNVKSLAPAT
jgi:hypothetical protein